MSNQQSGQQPAETSMIVTPRQEYLQRVRDEMAPGEQPAAIVPRTFAEVMTMCQALAQASIAPKHLRGNPVEMAMVVMTGLEVGLPPMASLRLYTTWDGVPRLMAEGVRAIILMRAQTIEYFEMATCDDNQATWIGKRRGRPEKSVTWTVERARKAGLLTKPVWQAYQQDMLNARASMQLGRILAPDVVAGMVALEEARDGDFIDAQSVEAKPTFVAPPPPQGPPPGVQHPVTGPTAIRQLVTDIERAAPGAVVSVTVTDTGTKPSGAPQAEPPKRGPGRPPRAQPSQTPGTDPFRAAREAVDAREAERPTAPASASTPSPQPSGSTSPTGSTSAAPAASSPTNDRSDPTSSAGSPSSSTTETATSAPSETASTASTASAGAQLGTWGPGGTWVEGKGDDFGGSEDPEDSQPVPTGDPGLALIADLQKFLAGCRSQTEMQNGRPPFAQRSLELFKSGDRRFEGSANGKPAGELAARLGQLWAERKAQLPV